MKKLLLGTAAVALGLSFGAGSAQAEGVKLSVDGHAKAYVTWNDQDDNLGAGNEEAREFDILRETELHFSGETTLDNGLTVGAHYELDLDGDSSSVVSEEGYLYFSGYWGRFNIGKEDGSAYLLQVATPSADSNIDGLRQYVQPVNYSSLTGGASIRGSALGENTGIEVSYDQDISGKEDKLTYITPVFSGFQAGVSYTPELGDATNGLDGVSHDDEAGEFGDVFDVAIRYEGQFDEVGVNFGAGYTHASLEEEAAVAAHAFTDDQTAWNAALDLDWGPFGVGVSYSEDDHGEIRNTNNTAEVDDEEIFVVGVDYTTGAFKLGASYYNADNAFGIDELETERYSAGVVYTYGPGMTFRGSVHYIEHDNMDDAAGLAASIDDADATSILVGTQINF